MVLSQGLEALCNASAAGLGGTCATTLTFPIDTIKTKMQSSKDGSVSELVKTILETQGPMGFFRGLESKIIWSFSGKFIYYGTYSFLQTTYLKMSGAKELGFYPNLLCGYVSEFGTLPVAMPFEAIATRLQASKELGVVGVVKDIYAQGGIGGFYKSISAYFVLCVTPAITNTVFTQIRQFVINRRAKSGKAVALGVLESFLLGAVARTLAVCIMFPFLRAKVIMQASKNEGKKESPVALIRRLVTEQGFWGLYRGIGPELVRGVLSSAITLMLKERIYAYNRVFFEKLSK